MLDYFDGMHTKFGADRILVKIKFNIEDNDENSFKFFTNSTDIKYVLSKVREMEAFPRCVTMRCNNNRYYIE